MPQQNAKVAIELYVDDKGSVRVKEFSGKSQEEFRKVETAGSGAADKIGGAWGKVVGVWGMVAAAATAAFAAVSALVVTSAKEAKELENQARLAKMASGEFKEYAYAAQSAGISTEKFADISKDVQDKLGDFVATGGGEFKDFMENVAPKVGLTAEALQKLSGPDVLVAVKKALDDANVSSAEQIFYLESIADDASLLIPILENSGKALKDKAARAKELGIALSEVDSKNLKEAGAATTEASSAFGGLKNAIAAEFAPVVTSVMRWVTDLIVDFKDEARAVAGTFANIAESFQGWKAVFDGRLSFFEFAKMDAKEFDGWLEKNRQSTESLGEAGKTAQKTYGNEIKNTTNALKYQEQARQKILDKHKTEAEKKAAAEKEMYEEAGFGAEKYFSAEATGLVEKAARWKKAGADVYQVEQWLYDQLGKLAEEAFEKGELAAGQNVASVQAMTGTITEQFEAAHTAGSEALNNLGMKADELNGKEIVLAARLDGSAVVTGVNSLIQDLQRLNTAASAATAAASSASSSSRPSYENTDSSMSASQVAEAESNYYADRRAAGNTVINNFNQQLSRSDAVAIASESKRREARS